MTTVTELFVIMHRDYITYLNLVAQYHCCYSDSAPFCNQRMLYDTCQQTTHKLQSQELLINH